MVEWISGITAIGGFVVGLLAKPLQEWVAYFLNGRNRKIRRKEKNIKDAFYFAQKLEDWPENLGMLISTIYLMQSGVQHGLPQGKMFDKKYSDHLKYILIYELPASDDIIKRIDELNNDISFAYRVALRNLFKTLKSSVSEEDKIIDKFIKNSCNGDSLVAANSCLHKMKNDVKELISDIQKFLKEEKSKLA